MSTTAGSSLGRQCARRLIAALTVAFTLVAQAGVTHGSNADIAAPPMSSGARTLDKALSGDLSTGDRNLDLLLESQRKGGERLDEAPVPQAMPDRLRGNRQLPQPLPEKAPAAQTPRPSEAGQRFEPMLAQPERGQLTTPGLATPREARDWAGGSGQAVGGPANADGRIGGNTSGLRSAARPLRDLIDAGVAYLKDNLFAILLVGAGFALLALGIKAYSRRI